MIEKAQLLLKSAINNRENSRKINYNSLLEWKYVPKF